MNFQDNQNLQQKFLEDMARKYQFSGDTYNVFMVRFSPANFPIDKDEILARKIQVKNTDLLHPGHKVKDELKNNIYPVLRTDDCPIPQQKGRPTKGQEPWRFAYNWLWEVKYPEWLNPPPPPPPDNENPFLPLSGMITNPHLFFNRQREIKKIFELLNSGSSVSLVGESAIGKSSLLQAIYRQGYQKFNPPRKTIYINLQLINNEDDFYGHLCDEIGIDNCCGNDLTKQLRNQKIILLLDEIEKMTWEGFTRNLRAYIRGLAETDILKLVVASRTPLDDLFPDSIGETSPFQGICITQNLGVWSEEIIREFIKFRLQGREIQFTDDDIQELINQSKGHPRNLMKLCFDKYNDYLLVFSPHPR